MEAHLVIRALLDELTQVKRERDDYSIAISDLEDENYCLREEIKTLT